MTEQDLKTITEAEVLERLAAQGITAIPFDEIDQKYVEAAEQEREGNDWEMSITDELEHNPLPPLLNHQYQFAMYGRAGETDAVMVRYTPQLCCVLGEIEASGIKKLRDILAQEETENLWAQTLAVVQKIEKYVQGVNAPQRSWLDNPARVNNGTVVDADDLVNIALAVERAFPVKAYQEIAAFCEFELVPEAVVYEHAEPIYRESTKRPEIIGYNPFVWIVEMHYVPANTKGRIEHTAKYVSDKRDFARRTTFTGIEIPARVKAINPDAPEHCHLRTQL